MDNTRKLLPLLLLAVMFAGCSRKIYIPIETVKERADSVQVQIHDSIRWEVITNVFDSVNVRDSFVVRVDSVGREVGRSEWHWRHEYHNKADSVRYYKELCDSLMNVKQRIETKYITKEVERKLTKWEQFKQEVGGIAIGISVAAIILIGLYVYRRIRNKFKII